MSGARLDNWDVLTDSGAIAQSSISGNSITIRNLRLEMALKIGHALTIELDAITGGSYTEKYCPFEHVVAEAEQAIKGHEHIVFGEMRPVNRNCAVRVEKWGDVFELVADLRNEYSDNLELNGSMILQDCFTETIESLDL